MQNKINTKKFYEKTIEEVKDKVKRMKEKVKYTCYIIKDKNEEVDPASDLYTSLKQKTSEAAGIECEIKKRL